MTFTPEKINSMQHFRVDKFQPLNRILIASALVLVGNVLTIDKVKAESGWLVKQIHRTYGPLNIYIRSRGVRIDCTKSQVSFACNAPDWTMVLYSHKRMTVCKKNFDEWSRKGIKTSLQIQNNDVFYDWPRVQVARKKQFGVETVIYAFPARLENGGPANLKHGKFAEYTLTESIKADKRVEAFMQQVEDVPPEVGIPLRFWKLGRSNSYGFGLKYNLAEERHDTVSTLKIERVSKINTAPDTAVATYKNRQENEVVLDQGQFNDVFRNLMTDEPDPITRGKKSER